MHSETPYEITPTTPYGDPHHRPTTVQQRPVILPADIPPGVDWVTLPNGVRTLAYTHPTPAPTPVPAAQPIPAWAKTTALLAPTVGGGIAAAGIGLSYAAPGLIAMSHALWSAAALIVAAVIAVPVLLHTARRATGSSGSRSGTSTHITQNVTATGLFGRANGTINHH
ncbi:hypothetical protein PV371_06685 [Streptomyces sp. TX20-6-3]|uniref:hypothetical protein n=1 Tax=Streptomyces sp. TX20-6-3 TaxID=3028705 RepID=UPI0029B419DB|nr:hypothetical protein [Streptomyces sp. TX20-6-3]MDX2559333.1 hypothetical protein [Streptomyces sp. TX20-6-3]